ncbi:appr-1-p processing enzyme family protein [Actinidia rufa]|uniref:Appr-1-p processing enzyme family protein n=1 Tax=Actinidia rufa TaxID=165716 RepID=A0A7J0FPW3_9ERIC|nr:appr-1-p processing enzyme family protein [Actinidia rufa]
MYQPVATTTARGGLPTDSGDTVVTLDQIPHWNDAEYRFSFEIEDHVFPNSYFPDPLTSSSGAGSSGNGMVSSSPGLHAAAGPSLAEECASLGGCRTGMAKITNAYDLPARSIIHTVGPKYAVKYHTAAENALSHCYRSCLELLIENGLKSIAMGCIYTEAKNYPREPAAHVAISNTEVLLVSMAYETSLGLLPLYFPRDKHEEEVAISKLPADVGDENGETVIDERKIRIKPLPDVKNTVSRPLQASMDLPVSDVGLTRRQQCNKTSRHQGSLEPMCEARAEARPSGAPGQSEAQVLEKNSSYLGTLLDPAFMSLIKDPDERRKEQWEKAAQAESGWNCAKMLGYGDLGGPPLSAADEYSLHSRYLAKANSVNLTEIAEMKIVYRGGVDNEGRPVMVVVGAHFLLRCLDLERFLLCIVKEFEPLIQKPYSIVYVHSAASLQMQPDLGWMKRLQQILGRKHQHNLHAIHVLHPTLGLRAAIFALQLFVDAVVWKKVVYADRLVQLFKYIPREQLSIPDFVFQHDLEVNGEKGLIVDSRTKYTHNRT